MHKSSGGERGHRWSEAEPGAGQQAELQARVDDIG